MYTAGAGTGMAVGFPGSTLGAGVGLGVGLGVVGCAVGAPVVLHAEHPAHMSASAPQRSMSSPGQP